jgi:hypothetical protein
MLHWQGFRLRGKFMKSRYVVVALAVVAVPQMVQAAVGSVTSASVNVRLAGRNPIERSSTHSAGAGSTNTSGYDVRISGGDYFARSSVRPGGGNAKLSLDLEMRNRRGALNEADATAKVTLGDALTFSNASQSSQILHLHKTIRLDQFGIGAFTPPFASEDTTSESVYGKAQISGDGITGGSITDEYNFFANSHGHTDSESLNLPSFIDFDLDFSVGETKEFDLSLSAFFQMLNLNDPFGTPFNSYSLAMDFLSGGTLTDVATGKAACGISATSASGFNYLAGIDIGACQVDGGGGDGGSDVPEPASWAMMLGGFGLIGGAMRTHRKAAVSFG